MSISDRLDQIERRASSATDGPWVAYPNDQTPGISHVDIPGSMHPTAWPGNAEFIADARTTVPALVAALRAVLDVCEGLEEAYRANPEQAYEYGLEEAAHQVRNTIAAALREES
ncbi:hypothetical protein NCCP2495_05580 [Dietzia sp. NCCP-2495]|uniref:hypothetical protein n=1 Tax=Dietzia sp. NCCP-2495 TaxID=2934675 RepID=UPI00222E300A|nr:hypothetical protein [Dietzia sp. NCCP-2495]GLB62680.1 hypothetical protein NCCP2495_05580 [Dietzia sp. NCCP-2495]